MQGQSGDGVGIGAAVINLTKQCLGLSMLAISQAAVSGTGLGSATLVILVLGLGLAWTFMLVGQACEQLERKRLPFDDFREVWMGLRGPGSAGAIDTLLLMYAVTTCTMYIPTMHSLLAPLLQACGAPMKLTGFPLRVLVALLAFFLSRVRRMTQMKWTSSMGTACASVSIGAVVIRLLDGSYAPGGRFFGTAGATPGQIPSAWAVGPSTVVLALRVSYGYCASYNAPQYYAQLRHRSAASLGLIALGAHALAASAYAIVMSCGVLTFGRNVGVPLLTSYAAADPLIFVARWMNIIMVATIFPLCFCAAQGPAGRLLARLRQTSSAVPSGDSEAALTSLGLFVAVLGTIINDLGLVLSLGGALLCGLFNWVLPAMLAQATAQSAEARFERGLHRLTYIIAIAIGIGQMLVGMACVLRV